MTRVPGPSLDQLDRLGDDYAALVARSLAHAARQMQVGSGVEDVGVLRDWWRQNVDDELLPALGVGFEVGAATIRVALREAVGLTAAGRIYTATERDRGIDTDELTAAAWTDVPPTSDALAEHYLAQARNRLVGVGDELWAHAREELLEGLRQGEGISELAARVRKVAPDLTEPRAEVIARTEVMAAVVAGALAQVRATGLPGTKEWIATDDERTRRTHDLEDHATIPLGEKFVVGGFPMDRPHDPAGPPQETISCRCSLGFNLDLPTLEPVTDEGVESAPDESNRTTERTGPTQGSDRSFLARVFAGGLAALVGWFKARTAAAIVSEQAFERGDDMTAAATEPDGTWEGVLTVEGSPTGDGREFAPGSLRWESLPLTLTYQPPSHGGQSGAGEDVGRIDEVWREGNLIRARGSFDLDGEAGREAHRKVGARVVRGLSVDVDDVAEADIELVFAEDAEEADLFSQPEKVIFHSARIRGAALLSLPAFVEAELELTAALLSLPAFVEAELELTGQAEAVAASAEVVDLSAYRPPVGFFARCTDPIPTLTTPDGRVFQPALGVSDDLRVWGYAAQWGECHIGYAGACTSPPAEDDYAHYLLGEVLCADGSRVPVGQITLGTGHADLRLSARGAAEHYDNTGAVVADVVVGSDDYGIWLSGAVRPGSPERVDALRAAGAVSGDWRRIGGALRLVALLTVTVPGFQQTRARVASGAQTALVAAGKVEWRETEQPDLSRVKERIAASIGRDRASRLAEVRERVNAGRS